ncbi:MAG: helix-turn-helix transcriptional regulator [Oscillospiraceae bacterium]|nr:helix-turn-helix transcriptional regulator [Oscillospiraceae bacterium]
MNRIKMLRMQRGLTQAELAQVLEVSASAIGMYEQGRREPDIKLLLRLSRFFRVPVDYIIGNSNGLNRQAEVEKFLDQVKKTLEERAEKSHLSSSEIEEIVQAIEAGISAVSSNGEE